MKQKISMRNRRWKSKFAAHFFRNPSVVVLYRYQLTSKMQIQQFITDLHGDDLKSLLSCDIRDFGANNLAIPDRNICLLMIS